MKAKVKGQFTCQGFVSVGEGHAGRNTPASEAGGR
jgi:hypothetical protein